MREGQTGHWGHCGAVFPDQIPGIRGQRETPGSDCVPGATGPCSGRESVRNDGKSQENEGWHL